MYSEVERLALEYAERITHPNEAVDDEIFEQLRGVFDEKQIVELTAGIAMENFRSKFNNALGVVSQGFCVLPER